MILCSFLSNPPRWCQIPEFERQGFWNDDHGACFWLLLASRTYQVQNYTVSISPEPPYADVLRASKRELTDRRVAAGAILAQKLPESILRRNGLVDGAHGDDEMLTRAFAALAPLVAPPPLDVAPTPLPSLPEELCLRVLDFVDAPPIDPWACNWPSKMLPTDYTWLSAYSDDERFVLRGGEKFARGASCAA